MRKIDEAKGVFGVGKTDIITHSTGGLIARYYVQNLYRNDVRKLAMVAPPNHGVVEAYEGWEGGDITTLGGFFGFIKGEILLCLMEAAYGGPVASELCTAGGFPNPLGDVRFIRERIQSAKDLLPIFPFLTRGRTRDAPTVAIDGMCEKNTFLLDLQASVSELANKGVRILIFAGIGRPTLRKLGTTIPTRGCTEDVVLWEDGIPVRRFKDAGGDGRVLLESARIEEVQVTEIVDQLRGNVRHDDLPTFFASDLVRFFGAP